MFERPQSGERAVLVHVSFSKSLEKEDIQEFEELASSAGVRPVKSITSARKSPDPRYLMGSSKVDEIAAQLEQHAADLVLVNYELSPSQERNLEARLKCQVLDRSGLILDIFAQRASSHEGRLQVELAQLQHLSTRLVRGWTHLERQKGGIGLRGPGETQLETDRRLIGLRIKQLNKRLKKVQNSRDQGRKSRKKAELPTVSLVGYTNAGKSTLFNSITDAKVFAADQLFATLDPTLRRVQLDNNQALILADTVGFIRDLPHDLIEAFKSTLEETHQADLLLHIVDAQSPDLRRNMEQVNAVLAEIGASEIPQIIVFNKVDLLEDSTPRIDRDEHGNAYRVWLSAQSGCGVELLHEVLNEIFQAKKIHGVIHIAAAQGRLRAKIYELGEVLQEQTQPDGNISLEVVLTCRQAQYLQQKEGLELHELDSGSDKALINYCG